MIQQTILEKDKNNKTDYHDKTKMHSKADTDGKAGKNSKTDTDGKKDNIKKIKQI